MPNLRSILCPVDFSEPSQEALRWAAALSARDDARLTVLTAVDPLLAEAARARLHVDLANTETGPALRTFVSDTLPAAAASKVSFDVRVGRADASILEAASHDVDLVVMGTHGLGGFRKWLLGSTTERVLRRTTTAVLAVPPPAVHAIDPGQRVASLDLKTILVGTDFSDASAAALQWADDLARRLGTALLLAHVVAPMLVPSRWRSYVADMDQERTRDAEGRLQGLSERYKGVIPTGTAVSIGQPAESLAALAKQRQAGMIAIGLMSEQEADSRAARPGSIAYRLLCLADVPVLVVPRPANQRN